MKDYSRQFIQKLQKQDATAFGEIYAELVDQFYRYIKSNYTLDDHTIQDLLSDIFMKIWHILPKIDTNASLSGFLRTICRNHVKDHFKRNDDIPFASFNTSQSDENDGQWEDNIADEKNILYTANSSYTFEQIQKAMDTLEESYRQAIHLKYIEEYGHDEIALIMGISQDAVRQRISRGLKRIQDMLSHLK